MKIEACSLQGVYLVQPEPNKDERGHFSRIFCAVEFKKLGIASQFEQDSLSFNLKKGTFRGMHFQKHPYAESKLVRCARGSAFDVVLDLRPDSKTFLKWQGFDLSAQSAFAVFIPPGCAHGFQTLEDNTELHYKITPTYQPGYSSGVRWNDPSFNIKLPLPISMIAERDRDFGDFAQ